MPKKCNGVELQYKINNKSKSLCFCTESSQSTSEKFVCEQINFCDYNLCLNNAKCKSIKVYPYVYCECPPGKQGVFCQDTQDICATNPCLNGGTCVPVVGSTSGFTCVCPAQYTGDRCESKFNSTN